MERDELKEAALHEACHALVAYVLGATIIGVNLKPKGKTFGSTRLNTKGLPLSDYCTIILAPLGSYLISRMTPLACEQDAKLVLREFKRLGQAPPAPPKEMAKLATPWLHFPHYSTIERLAEVLVEKREMSGQEVVEVIIANWPCWQNKPLKAKPLAMHGGRS